MSWPEVERLLERVKGARYITYLPRSRRKRMDEFSIRECHLLAEGLRELLLQHELGRPEESPSHE